MQHQREREMQKIREISGRSKGGGGGSDTMGIGIGDTII